MSDEHPVDQMGSGPRQGEQPGGHPHARGGAPAGRPAYPPGYDPVTHIYTPPIGPDGKPVYPEGYDPVTHRFTPPKPAGGAAGSSEDAAGCPVDHGQYHTATPSYTADGARRTMLVTGASRGIGLGIAQRLVDEGARVCITARQPEAL